MKIYELVENLNKYMTVLETKEACKNQVVIDGDAEVTGVLMSANLDSAAMDKAVSENLNVIVSYGNANLGSSDPIVTKLIKNDITFISLKNDLDVSDNGYENIIADALGTTKKDIFDITFKEKCYKLVSCIPKLPEDYTTQIRKAIGQLGVEDGLNGAGYIGTYSEVSDCMYGHQWFVTMPGADPFIGSIGDLSTVDVERFEIIIPEHQLDECVDLLWNIHPYEEVEYDVYPIMETRNHKGYGRFGEISPASKEEFISKVKEALGVSAVAGTKFDGTISKVAVFGVVLSECAEKMIDAKVNAVVTGSIGFEIAEKLEAAGIFVAKVEEFNMKVMAINKLNDFISQNTKVVSMVQNPFK